VPGGMRRREKEALNVKMQEKACPAQPVLSFTSHVHEAGRWGRQGRSSGCAVKGAGLSQAPQCSCLSGATNVAKSVFFSQF